MMNVVIRLTLLGALAILSACGQNLAAGPPPTEPRDGPKPVSQAPVPETACRKCKLENFLQKPHRVQSLECTNEGKPEHCHLEVKDGMPNREVTLTYNQRLGSYNWVLASPEKGQEKNRMECPNLIQNPDNKRVIEGTCIIFNSDQGTDAHFFRATVKPRDDDPIKAEIYFEFGHAPFDACSARPAHDGGGHIHGLQ
jgi:hypothetical protein